MIAYVALGVAALAIYFWLTGGKPIVRRREWRFLTGAFAIAAFTAAAFVGVRGGWGKAIVLVVVGLWLAATTRKAPTSAPSKPPRDGMGLSEARSILGVGPDATPEDIKEAHGRLMRVAHPDKGGTSGLAAQLNAARDRLLGRAG